MEKGLELFKYLQEGDALKKAGVHVLPEMIKCELTQADPKPIKEQTANGFYFSEIDYVVRISLLEVMAAKEIGNAGFHCLATIVNLWLEENDPDRFEQELGLPKLDADVYKDGDADVYIEIKFSEKIHFAEDSEADHYVEYKGKKYTATAETLEMITKVGSITLNKKE